MVAGTATLTACLAAPKPLALEPVAEVTGVGTGAGAAVVLSCADQRPERSGGIAPGSYIIDPKADVAQAVCGAAADGLRRMGYAPSIGVAAGPATGLRIDVLRVVHAVGDGTFKRAVEVEAELRATATASGRSHTTSYRAQRMREVAFSPRKETVQELSDETVSAALSRILSDQAVLAVLSGGGGGGATAPAPTVNEADTQTFPYR